MRTTIPSPQIRDGTIDTLDLRDQAVTDPKLNTTGASPGTYTRVTVTDRGRVTNGSNPTTLAGFGITDAIPTAQKGAANGVATLDAGSKLLTSQLPALAITDTFVVASQAAQLALVADVGDVAIRTDINTTFILRVAPATVLANWSQLLSPGGGVTSVAASAPAGGIAVAGSPITSSGTLVFSLIDDLAALESLTTFGFGARTATNTWTTRTFSGAPNQIDILRGDGAAGDPLISIANNPVIPGTASMVLPSGTSAQRPGTVSPGMVRFNSSVSAIETNIGTSWAPVGKIIQRVSGSIGTLSGTAQVPFDNSVPSVTEGFQIWTVSFTPLSATSQLYIRYNFGLAHASNRNFASSVFVGTTNIGLSLTGPSSGKGASIAHELIHVPGSIATITISCRMGADNSGTTFVNAGATQTLGGAGRSSWVIDEVI